MSKLSKLIKGLQILEAKELENIAFNGSGSFYIGELYEYTEEEKTELETLGFSINMEYDCFEYDFD